MHKFKKGDKVLVLHKESKITPGVLRLFKSKKLFTKRPATIYRIDDFDGRVRVYVTYSKTSKSKDVLRSIVQIGGFWVGTDVLIHYKKPVISKLPEWF